MGIAGNLLVELGLVMGVYSAEDINALPFGGAMQPQEHAREWCASVTAHTCSPLARSPPVSPSPARRLPSLLWASLP